jgi:hypothetical protein
MKNLAFTLVMMPLHRAAKGRALQTRSAYTLQPEAVQEAVRGIADADAAFGTIPRSAGRGSPLRWLQASNRSTPPASTI